MLTPLGYFDLIDAMGEAGCPVCRLLERDADKQLRTILYEYVTEPETHAAFRQSFGLCNIHGGQLTQKGNVMSIAVLYSAVVDEALKKSQQSDNSSQRLRGLFNHNGDSQLGNALTPNQDCLVCDTLSKNQTRYTSVVADKLTDKRLFTAFEASDGLCLSHFRQVVNQNSTPEFIDVQRAKWQQLHDQMQEFIRKYDPTKADSSMGEEGDSWMRAVNQISGGQGLYPLLDEDNKR